MDWDFLSVKEEKEINFKGLLFLLFPLFNRRQQQMCLAHK